MGKVSLVEKEWLGAETIFEEDDDDATATTAALTDVSEPPSDNDSDLEDDEDFAAENLPRDPPAKLLYGGEGETPLCVVEKAGGDVATPKGESKRPGRSTDDVPEGIPKRQCLSAQTLPEVNSERRWIASATVDVPKGNSERQCLSALTSCVPVATSVDPAKDTRANA